MKFKKLPWLISLSLLPITSFAEEIEETIIFGQLFSSESEAGSRLGLELKEIPATVDVINGDAIRIRGDISVLTAVSRSAGFVGLGNPGNGGSNVTARGFSGQEAVTKLYDGNHYFTLAGTNTFPFDTWAIDRIEILKGPASVLYGIGGVAGAYNVIPKSPSETRGLDLRLSLGENNERFFGFGATGPLSDTLKGRVDFSERESDNWVENGESESQMLALALEWQPTQDLTLSFRHDAGDQRPMRYFGIPVVDGDFNEDWLELNLNVEDSRIRYQDDITRFIVDWTISESIDFNTELFSLNTDRYWQTLETYFYDADSGLIDRWDPLIIRHEIKQLGFRSNFLFDTELGSLGWKSVVGIEATDISMDYTSNFNPSRTTPWSDFDTVDPENFDAGAWNDVTETDAALDQVSDTQQAAVYAETQLKILSNFAVSAGFRYDLIETDYNRLDYTDPNDTGVSQEIDPLMFRIGTVFNYLESGMFYTQYSSGETHANGGDVLRVRDNLREADTVTVEQAEIGIKQAFLNERLLLNAALFDITRKNMLIRDPDSDDPSAVTSVPEQTGQGIEVGLNYTLAKTLSTYANFSVLEAERETGDGAIETPYIPETTFNAGVLYSPLQKLSLAMDLRYVDERPANPGDPTLSAYTLVDVSASWMLSEEMRVSIGALNLTDELYASSDHWTGAQWSVGQPRTFMLTFDLNI